jgi:hypothetical protein
MPFAMPLIFSTLINNIAWAIGLEITLAILGLVNLSIPTLGTMLNWALFYQSILFRTLVVDLDAGGLIALPVYRPLLALGQHQRISRPAHAHPAGRGVGGSHDEKIPTTVLRTES